MLDADGVRCAGETSPLQTYSEHSLCAFYMNPGVVVTIVIIFIVLIMFGVFGETYVATRSTTMKLPDMEDSVFFEIHPIAHV